MTDSLSPAAQAVWEAFNEDEAGMDYGDKLAAALEALAEYVVLPKRQYAIWGLAHAIHGEILTIAAELRGTTPTEAP